MFSNFFFIKKLFRLITGISKDMRSKREKLLAKVKDDKQVLDNIETGFNYMQDIKERAYERMEQLR